MSFRRPVQADPLPLRVRCVPPVVARVTVRSRSVWDAMCACTRACFPPLQGACERKLEAGKVPANGRCTYRVVVSTSDLRGAGTDANVAMTLYGEKGDTGQRKLDSSANDFERGKVRLLRDRVRARVVQVRARVGRAGPLTEPACLGLDSSVLQARVQASSSELAVCVNREGEVALRALSLLTRVAQKDTFFFEAPDVGRFNSLRIGHDNSGFGAAWHLATVEVVNTNTGEQVRTAGCGTRCRRRALQRGRAQHTWPTCPGWHF